MSGEAQRRRAQAASRRMDERRQQASGVTVLLDTKGLNEAAKEAQKGGSKNMGGLYLPGGEKIEAGEGHIDVSAVKNARARQGLALQRVAKTYQTTKDQRRAKAAKARKREDDFDDEESTKKADGILGKSTEKDNIQYMQLFSFFDVDGDRNWGSIEFAQRMTDIGYATSIEEASNLLYFAGVRDVDRITYNDFIQMMPKLKAFRMMLEKDAMRAFADKDPGTGIIGLRLAREAYMDLAGPDGIEDSRLETLVKMADREKTGKISYDFFAKALFGPDLILAYQTQRPGQKLLARLFGCGTKPISTRRYIDDDADDQEDLEEEHAGAAQNAHGRRH